MSDLSQIRSLKNKEYRDSYLDSMTRATVAHQIQVLRSNLGMTQAQFAKKIGKPQSVVSRLENPDYGKVSVLTLIEVACALDIAINIRFCSYPEFLLATADVTATALSAESIHQTAERLLVKRGHPERHPQIIGPKIGESYPMITGLAQTGSFVIVSGAEITPFTLMMQVNDRERGA